LRLLLVGPLRGEGEIGRPGRVERADGAEQELPVAHEAPAARRSHRRRGDGHGTYFFGAGVAGGAGFFGAPGAPAAPAAGLAAGGAAICVLNFAITASVMSTFVSA